MEIEREIIIIKEDIASLKKDVEYIRLNIDKFSSTPCRKNDLISMNRKLIGILFTLILGVISYLTGMKFI